MATPTPCSSYPADQRTHTCNDNITCCPGYSLAHLKTDGPAAARCIADDKIDASYKRCGGVPGSYICNNTEHPLHNMYSTDFQMQYPSSLSNPVVCVPQTKKCDGHYELTTYYPFYPNTMPNNPVANSGQPGSDMLYYVDLRCVEDGPDADTPGSVEVIDGAMATCGLGTGGQVADLCDAGSGKCLRGQGPCATDDDCPAAPAPAPAGAAGAGAGGQQLAASICKRVLGNETVSRLWKNAESSQFSDLSGQGLWDGLSSTVGLINCSIDTKPDKNSAIMNQCMGDSTGGAAFYKVTCPNVPFDSDLQLMGAPIPDGATDGSTPDMSGVQWTRYGYFNGGQAIPGLLKGWDCQPDERTSAAGRGPSRRPGTSYTCTGYTDQPDTVFTLSASPDTLSCDKPSFAQCVSCLYNNFQKVLALPEQDESAYDNNPCVCPTNAPYYLQSSDGTMQCYPKYTECAGGDSDDPSCSQVCLAGGAQKLFVEAGYMDSEGDLQAAGTPIFNADMCAHAGGKYTTVSPSGAGTCPLCTDGVYKGKPCDVLATNGGTCPGANEVQVTPPPRMGMSQIAGMPTFKASAGREEHLWVPSQWPSMASPIPKVLESCSGAPNTTCPGMFPAKQDLITMVQYICAATQVAGPGRMIKYTTRYRKEDNDAVTNAIFANLNTGCQQGCKNGACTGDGRSCQHNMDCPGYLTEIFRPVREEGTCTNGKEDIASHTAAGTPAPCLPGGVCQLESSYGNNVTGKACSQNSDCQGEVLDVRNSYVDYANKCQANGGTWQWYKRPPTQAEKPFQAGDSSSWFTTYRGYDLKVPDFLAILPQESVKWTSQAWDPSKATTDFPSFDNMCQMYVVDQWGQAPQRLDGPIYTTLVNPPPADQFIGACMSGGKMLTDTVLTPQINSQGPGCPPFCGSPLKALGEAALAVSFPVEYAAVSAVSSAISPKTIVQQGAPGADQKMDVITACAVNGSKPSENDPGNMQCVTGSSIQVGKHPQELTQEECEQQGGRWQQVTLTTGGSYNGSIQCYPRSFHWECSAPKSVPQDDTTNEIECSPVMLGTSSSSTTTDTWQNPGAGEGDKAPLTGTGGATANRATIGDPGIKHVNRMIEMHPNYMNAQFHLFNVQEKNTKVNKVTTQTGEKSFSFLAFDNYNMRGFARDYLHWLYG